MPKKPSEQDDLQQRYRWLREITDDVIAERSKIAEFHGLEQELRELQRDVLTAYERSVQLKHPRDKGDFREEILKQFLVKHGLLPNRYSVAQNRVRAVAPSGHISPELDIVIHDRDGSIVLRRLDGTVDYLPIECIHGAIQVKSKLTKKALLDGLDNLKQFKSLVPSNKLEQNLGGFTLATGLFRRFGVLFAYEGSMKWEAVCRELQDFARQNPPEVWPNLVVVLDKGYMVLGDDKSYAWKNRDQLKIETPIVYGHPDLTASCLLDFYSILLELLKDTPAGSPDLNSYWRMPLTSGSRSYSFSHGATAEMLTCPRHGAYLKRISERDLTRIADFSRSAERINWVKAIDLAGGGEGNNEEAYERQPGMVRIFNPDGLPLTELLMKPNGVLSYDSVEIDGMTVLLPYHYIARDDLFEECPTCTKEAARTAKKTPSSPRSASGT
ncbi:MULTISPECIES: DUF6602 domain-containing protein [Rhizobium]|uniref:DUF6602 domain-containing protein n=1 Tax=Rhizobium ruizarguesonis TaxID=2081791 RepID=A0AAE8QEV7_9HYPH|nr:DUF6602 domain-containing protein [Rhizobium ruizarguesonis]NEJ26943.1 hypothetical protein [Rhizobium ruizarguesonis]TBD09855.1 hypothetical protein ELH23_33165 [Rhizobium ruizarguesonis]TBF18930.1 hypothetical protein ELG94_11710 [Rhizobium ruizarguesonis]